jgi:hypothetical protein
MAADPTVESSPQPAPAPAGAPVVITLSRQSSKRVKQLVRGKGRLLDRIIESVDQLKEQGRISGDAQPILVVVRESEVKGIALFG